MLLQFLCNYVFLQFLSYVSLFTLSYYDDALNITIDPLYKHVL